MTEKAPASCSTPWHLLQQNGNMRIYPAIMISYINTVYITYIFPWLIYLHYTFILTNHLPNKQSNNYGSLAIAGKSVLAKGLTNS